MNLLTTLKGSLLKTFSPLGGTWPSGTLAWPTIPKPFSTANQSGIRITRFAWRTPWRISMSCSVMSWPWRFADRNTGRKLALILPVGPMGMYRWTVYFLRDWKIPCDHVTGFNMDEWSDAEGNTLPSDNTGAFQYAMQNAFYGPLADLTVPPAQRFFATRKLLPEYPDRIGALRKDGAKLVVVYGIGRACYIAFWEPHFGVEFASDGSGANRPIDSAPACTQ